MSINHVVCDVIYFSLVFNKVTSNKWHAHQKKSAAFSLLRRFRQINSFEATKIHVAGAAKQLPQKFR